MNKEAIELIEQKKRFCENMIEIETNYENQVYKDMVKENRIFEYILKILKENEIQKRNNLQQALNEVKEKLVLKIKENQELIERLDGTSSFRIGNAQSKIKDYQEFLQIINEALEDK